MSTSDKKTAVLTHVKHNLSYVKDVLAGIPVYKWPLLPLAFLIGFVGETMYIINGHKERKQFIDAIKSKYRIAEVKLDAVGCQADIGNIFQSQMVILEVDGKDYAFLLTWNNETNEPYLDSAPMFDETFSYQSYPEDPKTLLR